MLVAVLNAISFMFVFFISLGILQLGFVIVFYYCVYNYCIIGLNLSTSEDVSRSVL